MSGTTIVALNRSMQTTMEWLHDIRDELGWDDDERVYDATKAVLHTIRDRIPLEVMAKFAAQLPMVLSGVFYDQYDPTKQPAKLRSREDFLERIRENSPEQNMNSEEAVRGVMKGLGNRVGQDSLDKIALNMPENIRDLIRGQTIRR